MAVEPQLERASRRELLDTRVKGRRGLIQLSLQQKAGGDRPVRGSAIQARSHDRLDLGGEQPAVLALVQEERLHPEAIARAEQHAAAPIVDHERPHAVQPGEAPRAPLPVRRE